jgi:DeoR/GlpR family transcriptional regulator of sugar metabolism
MASISGSGNGIIKGYQLISLLRKNGKMKTSEIADTLGVSERTIGRMKVTLNKAGIPVESDVGKVKGGFWINEPRLDDAERIILKDLLKNNKKIYEKIEYHLTKTL